MIEPIQRILGLMERNGDNAHSLEVNAKLPISSITNWKSDKYKPSMDSIIKLAQYFNVSADYLLCLSDNPTPLTLPNTAEQQLAVLSTAIAELSQDERFIESVKLYKAMPNEYRQQVYAYILGVATGLRLNTQKILEE